MTDFERLIEAAKRGDLADVRAILTAHGHAELVNLNQRDPSGATALHHAAFGGHRSVVHELVSHGADINATDSQFGATPAGWAIEYLREMGGFLAIELDDFAHAIRRGDVEWVRRFLHRIPALRAAVTRKENRSSCLPRNLEIRKLWICLGQLLSWDSMRRVGQPGAPSFRALCERVGYHCRRHRSSSPRTASKSRAP